ncbi:MAG: hypothetical protein OMOMHJEC_03342 [Xanthomonadales bacterium]|nr:hypothetical protein [Xanthomonadales bacterium]
MVVKEGTEITLLQDCRVARGGYAGGRGRRRAVSGRVALTLWNADWVPRDLRPDCRIVRGGYSVGGGRRRAVGGRVSLALRNVAWVPRHFEPDCRVVRGGSLWVGVRRRALAGGHTFGACSWQQVWAFDYG